MVYKAIIKMNEYKPGDIVPDEIAKVWAKMYLKSPVELVDDNEASKEENVFEEVEEGKYSQSDLEKLSMRALRKIGRPLGAMDTKKSELIDEILEKQ